MRVGEACGRDRRWDDAVTAFEEAVGRYPGTRFATWALLKIGHTQYIDLQNRESGRPSCSARLPKVPARYMWPKRSSG
jgi:hypothetical protein